MVEKNIIEEIRNELITMGLNYLATSELNEIRNKDGIYLYRVNYRDKSYVIKYYKGIVDTREILNYSILNRLNIPTINLIECTDKCLLLEDIDISNIYRLGIPSDLSDVEIARLIAKWYKTLHIQGERYLRKEKIKLYRETDIITEENIALIKDKSGIKDNYIWQEINNNFQLIRSAISILDDTLTYNDFYWTNLIVKKDKSSALMLDYNLLGIGYSYGDIRNICLSLSNECKAAFLNEYGAYNYKEKVIDDVISPLISLIFAFRRISFPSWGNYALEQIKNRKFNKSLEKLIDYMH